MSVPEMSMFKNVNAGTLYVDVDEYFCILFINIRNATKTGVLHFVSVFSGLCITNMGPAATGLLCGSDAVVVIKLEKKDYFLLDEYLKAEKHTEADAQQAICRRKIWYMIVDGWYRHEGFKQVISKEKS